MGVIGGTRSTTGVLLAVREQGNLVVGTGRTNGKAWSATVAAGRAAGGVLTWRDKRSVGRGGTGSGQGK